jgi:hypothetical protein
MIQEGQSEEKSMDTVVRGPNQKCCRDCGKVIMERAEICPGCGCRQIGVPPFERETATSAPFIPLRTEAILGALFSVVALFVLHFYFVANWRGMLFGGSPFFELVEYLVVGTLIGSVLWTGTTLLVSAIGAREPKVLLIACGVIQGAVLVPIAAYLEPSYLRAEASFGIAACFALVGGGYAFWLSFPASLKLLGGIWARVGTLTVVFRVLLIVIGCIFVYFSLGSASAFYRVLQDYQVYGASIEYAMTQVGSERVISEGAVCTILLAIGLGCFWLAHRMRSRV